MQSTASQISDSRILILIKENNLKGWEILYDKFAPVMYGVICTHTADKSLAEEILISLFIRLKYEQILLKENIALCASLLRYTYSNARMELKKRGIHYTEYLIVGNSTHHLFCSQCNTIKEVAVKLRISEKEVKQNLHKEFLMLREKNQYYPANSAARR